MPLILCDFPGGSKSQPLQKGWSFIGLVVALVDHPRFWQTRLQGIEGWGNFWVLALILWATVEC